MIRFLGTISGLESARVLLHGVEPKATAAVGVGMRRAMLGGQSIVRSKASGRPGPRVRTGDFRRSILGDVEISGTHVLGQIGTNAPQALRLEFGFYGVDSLGRRYAQPPYPYMSRAVPEVEALARSEVAAAVGAIS